MAKNPKVCESKSYKNLNCCNKDIGISIVQPECHCLPDGRVVTNPSYVSSLNKSFWTYKLITDCNDATIPVTSFVIPICEVVRTETLTVSEKIDGCGKWTSIPYTLTKTDSIFGDAPKGFQFVKIEINDRYSKGVSVAYRLELKGNYPESTQPISINTDSTATVFDCNGGFLVPECNPQGKLSITKNVNTIIKNNQAKLEYSLEVDNIGNATLESVELSDILFLPTQLTPGKFKTVPGKLKTVINPNGEIRISGNLGKLSPGEEIIVTYTIPIAGISSPGQYIINNIASVTSEGTEASDRATATIDVVKLESNKCCNVLGNGLAEFRVTIANVGDSPNSKVSILDDLLIPTGITVRFSDFDGCNVVFARTGEPVPINTDVTGNADIRITCDNIEIPKGGSAQKILKFKLMTSSVSGSTVIKNELEQVNLTTPDNQIFLGAGILPVEAGIRVILNLECQKPC